MSQYSEEIERRRTFAIISHPDAGKTTLTEKLLLFGGAIHVAGAVKSNKIKKTATSDWMEIEKQRGISVATSVMAFDYSGHKINILDTPGHQDFAEDTFRTLTAVDSVIIVIDTAKGVEAQTRKLMEVCRMRKTPVIVFVNKMDRDGKDPFDLLDEIEEELHIHVRPLSWPIDMGQRAVSGLDGAGAAAADVPAGPVGTVLCAAQHDLPCHATAAYCLVLCSGGAGGACTLCGKAGQTGTRTPSSHGAAGRLCGGGRCGRPAAVAAHPQLGL